MMCVQRHVSRSCSRPVTSTYVTAHAVAVINGTTRVHACVHTILLL